MVEQEEDEEEQEGGDLYQVLQRFTQSIVGICPSSALPGICPALGSFYFFQLLHVYPETRSPRPAGFVLETFASASCG